MSTHHRVKQSPKSTTGILHCLHDAVQCKIPKLWSTGNWHFHHNNAPAHSSYLIQTFLAKIQTPVVCQAPYSSDDSLRLLAVPQTQEAIERKVISDKRGHYDCNNSQAKHHSEIGFLGIFPTMAAPLGEVCGVPRRKIRLPAFQVCLFFSPPDL